MPPKDIKFSAEARERMLKGVDILTGAVRVTLGPRGRNVLYDVYGGPRFTKDGVTVAKEIELEDRYENLGAQMVREVASKTSEEAGDGTTTATILAHAFAQDGAKAVVAGMNPMDIRRGVDAAVAAVVADLQRRSRAVSTNEEITQVGTISANGDRSVGEMLAEAMERVGKDGVIRVDEGQSLHTELRVVDGMNWDRGYLSPHFVTDMERQVCELDDPYILIHESRMSGMAPMVGLLEAVLQAERPLLVIAEDVEDEAMAALAINRTRLGLLSAAVKPPGFSDSRQPLLEDLAVLTGGQLISDDVGTKIDDVTLDMLVTAKRVVVTKSDTTIIEGAGNAAAIESRCAEIKAQIEETAEEEDQEKLRERVARLVGGIALIEVGGATREEVLERKDLVDDALAATRAAAHEGIVAGGGVALLNAVKVLDKVPFDNDDQRVGIDIVRRALVTPVRQIADNAGFEGAIVVGKLMDAKNHDHGFDARAGEYRDLVKAGIIDPTKVVRTALQDAASVAGQLITSEAMVVEIPTPPSMPVPQMPPEEY